MFLQSLNDINLNCDTISQEFKRNNSGGKGKIVVAELTKRGALFFCMKTEKIFSECLFVRCHHGFERDPKISFNRITEAFSSGFFVVSVLFYVIRRRWLRPHSNLHEFLQQGRITAACCSPTMVSSALQS